ncbi:MAG TPA: hypothetical protein VID72_02675 [Ktedonobacterales bacterium]
MTRSNRPRALGQRRAPNTGHRMTWRSALAALWSVIQRRGPGQRIGAAALLVVCASLLTGAQAGSAAGAKTSQRQVALRVSPPAALPPVARWIDVRHGTSYTVVLQANVSIQAVGGYRFTFTTPAGDQLAGALPITKLADGSYAQSTPVNSAGAPTCFQGVLSLSKNSGGVVGVVYTLVTHFDQYAMVAYAHLVYAPARDQAGVAAVCAHQTGQGSEQALDMLSGCSATACTQPVDSAGPAVTTFESSVVGAARQGSPPSWKQAYTGTSRVITAQYGSDRFGTLIEAQARTKGRITSITPANTSPQVQFDAAGQAYFSVTDAVGLDKSGGNTATVTVTSYYLLESGQWVFWFSMPVAP